VAKTCKSHGVAIPSGERESNESLTYPGLWDSHPKGWVIPDDIAAPHGAALKGPPVWERAISYQLVGGVTAHQGDDA
jgi:hypothetical protein